MLRNLGMFPFREMPENPGGGGDELSVAPPAPEAPAPAAVAPEAPGAPGSDPAAPEPATAPEPAAATTFTEEQLEQELEARLAPFMQHMPLIEALAAAAEDPSIFGPPDATPPGAAPPLELDPLSETFGTDLQQVLASERNETLKAMTETMQQMLAPITGRFEQEGLKEGDERAMDIIADDVAKNGDLTEQSKTLARQMSEQFFGEFAEKYGNTPRAAEAAIRKATATVRDIERVAGESAVERYKNQLETLGAAPHTPGAPGAGVTVTPPGGDELSVAARFTGGPVPGSHF